MRLVSLNQVAPWTDDFFFMPYGEKDELVICNPQDSTCISPAFLRSRKTLEEHIKLVNDKQIKKAMVVAENIAFLRQCPSLEELRIIPSLCAQDFDFSPLYDLPNLRKLICDTVYGPDEDRVAQVDYSRIPSLESLVIGQPKGHENVSAVRGLKELAFHSWKPKTKNLSNAFQGQALRELSITASNIATLDGIENAPLLETLKLSFNRNLTDISMLASVKDTLRKLDIYKCRKIKDFSVLSELHGLEDLRLRGSNVLPDLAFIRNMPRLKSFVFLMNSTDGDLSMCEGIPYVQIQDRKHYSHKDEDFSKNSR